MPRRNHIPQIDLEVARDLTELSKIFDSSIRTSMFPAPPGRFREIEEEPVLGPVEPETNPFTAQYLDRFGPMKRLLSTEDEIWVKTRVPRFAGSLMGMRRRLMTSYADELSDDLDLLWLGKRLKARVAKWNFVEMLVWRAEGLFLVTQLRTAITLHWIGTQHAQSLAHRVLSDLEAFIAAAVRETRHPLLRP